MGNTGMTSFPIPSAGIRPILKDCLLTVVEKDLIGSLNIIEEEKRVFIKIPTRSRLCRRTRENAFIL